jgi:hypothetical protein
VSLATTSITTALFASVAAESFTAVGGWFANGSTARSINAFA